MKKDIRLFTLIIKWVSNFIFMLFYHFHRATELFRINKCTKYFAEDMGNLWCVLQVKKFGYDEIVCTPLLR